jgi:hypothetical protein
MAEFATHTESSNGARAQQSPASSAPLETAGEGVQFAPAGAADQQPAPSAQIAPLFSHFAEGAGAVQRNEAGGAGGAGRPMEQVAGTLWALDDQGKPLPPSLADIQQGGLNDCFLFAAMSAVVISDPQKVKGMIQDNGNGTYTVTFKGLGFFSDAKQTVSAEFEQGRHGHVTARKALWPLIVEKAYAQEKGGTDKFDKGGNPGDAVDAFTNKGPSRFNPTSESADYVLKKLQRGKEVKAPMTVLAPKKDDASAEKKQMTEDVPGLFFWHAYAIEDVDPVGKRVKLFNPHGGNHPNGDGWISIDQFRKFFIEVNIND